MTSRPQIRSFMRHSAMTKPMAAPFSVVARFPGGRCLMRCAAALFFAILSSLLSPALASKYASIVVDESTETVLYSRNADKLRYPASLTKIMTLYLIFEDLEAGRISLKSRIPVSKRAAGRSPSKLYLKPGQSISVEQAIYALVTKSANDVATAAAEKLAGSERNFAKRMTRKARALGMNSTTFKNASGLPNRQQKSTARDMATLAIAIRRDFPQFYRYFSTKTFSWKGQRFKNHNQLLSNYSGTDGIKTGYIGASGFNLVASVQRAGRRLIGVVFGGKTSRSRDRHMMSILDKQFKRSRTITVRRAALPVPDILPKAPPRRPSSDQNNTAGAASALPSVVPHTIKRDPRLLWSVQIGNYARRVNAHRAAIQARRMASDVLKMTPAHLMLISRGNMPLWRVRFNNLDEDSARAACAAMFSAGSPCIAVPNSADNANG